MKDEYPQQTPIVSDSKQPVPRFSRPVCIDWLISGWKRWSFLCFGTSAGAATTESVAKVQRGGKGSTGSRGQQRLFVFPKWRKMSVFGLAYQGKDIVFRFILEYSSLMDFGPYVCSSRSIFIWGFLKDDILACWNIWVCIILLLP
jgi:hypothetical protein